MELDGYKTYIIEISTIMWAAGGFVAGKVDGTLAAVAIFGALQIMGLRNGMPKKE